MGMQKNSAGFTIIEVMLFLAVSGALAVGVLATATAGINNQRYTDAVNSFKALVQDEFINTTRVVNTRQDSVVCGDAESRPVGATECVIMGRLLSVDSEGNITQSNLIGTPPNDDPVLGSSDIEDIKKYSPHIDSTQQTTDTMKWGTTIQRRAAKQPVSVVVFRAPVSGNILAFVKTGVITSDRELNEGFINSTSEFKNDTPKYICIDPSGWTIAQTQVIVIPAYAASPSVIEQRSAQGAECS